MSFFLLLIYERHDIIFSGAALNVSIYECLVKISAVVCS